MRTLKSIIHAFYILSTRILTKKNITKLFTTYLTITLQAIYSITIIILMIMGEHEYVISSFLVLASLAFLFRRAIARESGRMFADVFMGSVVKEEDNVVVVPNYSLINFGGAAAIGDKCYVEECHQDKKGIVYHEKAHVVLGHMELMFPVSMVANFLPYAVASGMAMVGFSMVMCSLGFMVSGLAAAGLLLQWRKANESEADAYAVKHGGGQDLLDFLETIVQYQPNNRFLAMISSHPAPTKRIADIEAAMESLK